MPGDPSEVSDAGAVATDGGTVTVLGAVAAGRDVHIGAVTIVNDDGPPVGDQLGRPGAATDPCPYPGLRAFAAQDGDRFFGRDADRDAILALVGRAGLVAVVGSSGSGKSSLLAAAVVPGAAAGQAPATTPWEPVPLRPGPDPVAALEEARHRRTRGRPVLWVLDQFEEVFDPAVDPERRREFFDALVALTTDPGRSCVLIALRSDFYPALDADPRLARAVAAAQHRLVPLDPAAVEAAVVQPAERVGLRVEPGLVDEIRREMAANPSALPLLGYALQQTWRRRRNGWLTLAGYADSGGIRRALQDGAQRAWAGLSAERQGTAQRLLLRLSYLDDGGVAVRRRRPVADLVTDLDDQAAVTATVNSLAAARLLTLSEDADGQAVVEIAHEALLVEWPMLRDWLRADRDAARVRDELIEAVQGWTTHHRDPAYLLSGGRLAVVRAQQERSRLSLTSDERRFLAESARRDRRQRTVRRLLPSLAVLLLLVTGLAGLAVADQQRAVRARQTATALQVAASSRSVVAGQRDLGTLLALAAYRAHADPTTLSTLVDAVAGLGGPLSYARPAPFADALDPVLTPAGDAVLGLSDGRVELLPAAGGPPRYLTGNTDAVSVVRTMGRSDVVSGDLSGVVVVHRLGEAQPAIAFTAGGPGRPVTAMAVDAARHLVVAAVGDEVHRYSTTTPSRHFPVLRAGGEVTDLAVDGAHDQVVDVTSNGLVSRWRAATGAALAPLASQLNPLPATTSPRLALDPVAGLAVVDGQQLDVWARPGDAHPARSSVDVAGARSVIWTSDHARLLVADATGAVTAWQPAARPGAAPVRLGAAYRGLAPVGQEGAPGPAMASDGRQLVGLDGTGAVLRWQLSGTVSPAVRRISLLDSNIRAVSWSSGNRLATGELDGTVTLLDATGKRIASAQLPGRVDGVVWRTPSEVVAGAGDGSLFALAPGSSPRRIAAATGSPVVAVVAAGAGQVAALHESGLLQIIGPGGRVTLSRQFPPQAHALAMSRSGQLAVATGDLRQTVITLEDRDGSHRRRLAGHALQVDSLAFSPDGKQLASGSDDRTIRLWSTGSGRLAAVLRGHTDMVTSLGYGSGGTELASGSQDGTLRLWSVAAAKELGAPLVDVQGQYVQALAVSPDGSGLLAGNGGALDAWPLSPAGWARAACALAARELTAAEWTADAPGVHPHRLCPATPTT